jgi:superfamily II DNA helicase RecQ
MCFQSVLGCLVPWFVEDCKFDHMNISTMQRFVIHNTLSKSIESYHQESGRAGRDDLPANCIILYQKKDFSRIVCMLRNADNFKRETFKVAMEQAKKMQAYCELNVGQVYVC